MQNNSHEHWMKEALKQAAYAQDIGEVPVGAIVVIDNKIVGVGYNKVIQASNPSMHAEVVAIEDACKKVGNYRLTNASLYVTLEPCAMCAGLITHTRLQNLIVGALDPKTGACGSVLQVLNNPALNHKVELETGLLASDCSKILTDFFKSRR